MKDISKKYLYISLLLMLYVITAALNNIYPVSQQGKLVDGEVQTNFSELEKQTTVIMEKQTDINEKKVALTFDDGPGPHTEKLLDGLKERGVKATFFVIGKNVCEYKNALLRMKEEGHLIGNHTYSHVQLNQMSETEAILEIEQTNDLIEKITGRRPDFIRPPYGEYSNLLRRDINMFVALWNVDPLDWQTTDVDGIVRKVLQTVEPGDVILLHDIYETSVQAALQIVDELLKQEYQFVTIEELLIDM